MYKIAALGDFESIAYFGAIGADTFFPESGEDAAKIVKRLIANGYAVIFISEKYADSVKGYEGSLLPAVITLPQGNSNAKTALKKMSDYVKQAVGSDIIFNQ